MEEMKIGKKIGSFCGYCGADYDKVVCLTTGRRWVAGTNQAAKKAVKSRDKDIRFMLIVCPACGVAVDVKEG